MDVFISHSTPDDRLADKIGESLDKAKLSTWIDHQDRKPSAFWEPEIDVALNTAKCGLLIASSDSLRSPYCRAEWTRLISRGKQLFVLLTDVTLKDQLPAVLATINYVILDDAQAAINDLVLEIEDFISNKMTIPSTKMIDPILLPVQTDEFSDLVSGSSIEDEESEITADNPLLIGLLVDISRSMLDRLNNQQRGSTFSTKKLNDAVTLLVEKAVAFCKTPEADDVLPRFALFAFGYGFGRLRQQLAKTASRLGLLSTRKNVDSIPTSLVRDLFADTALNHNLPPTPSARELNKWWSFYQKGIEAQIIDSGGGASVLADGLDECKKRFEFEILRFRHPNLMLLILSDGEIHEEKDDKIISDRVRDLELMGVRIACFYIGLANITQPKKLYETALTTWSPEAKRLFHCASKISTKDKLSRGLLEIAQENHWQITQDARLFFEANNSEFLNEAIDGLLRQMKVK